MINKQESKYILYASLFALAWFIFVVPFLQSAGIENSSPIIQFLIFNAGTFFFFQILLTALLKDKRIVWQGALGVLLLFMAIDIWQPPLLVGYHGEFLTGSMLSASSSDYIVGLLAKTIGFTGFGIFFFTYIISPVVLLFIAGRLLPNFVKRL